MLPFLVVFLACFAFKASAQEEGLYLVFFVNVEDGSRKDAKVVVFKDGEKKRSMPGSKRMEYQLEFGANYVLEFQADNYITKKIEFNTEVPEGRKDYPFEPFGFNVTIFPQYDEINTIIFNQPVAKVAFTEDMDDFGYDTDYTKSIQAKMAEVEEEIKEIQEKKSQEASGKGKLSPEDAAAISQSNKLAQNAMDEIDKNLRELQELTKGLTDDAGKKALQDLLNTANGNGSGAKKLFGELDDDTPRDLANSLADDIRNKADNIAEILEKAKELRNQLDADARAKKIANAADNDAIQKQINNAGEDLRKVQAEINRLKKIVASNLYTSGGQDLANKIKASEIEVKKIKNIIGLMQEDIRPESAAQLAEQVAGMKAGVLDNLTEAEEAFNKAASESADKKAISSAIREAREAINKALLAQSGIDRLNKQANAFSKDSTEEKTELLRSLLAAKELNAALAGLKDELSPDGTKEDVLALTAKIMVQAEEVQGESKRAKEAYSDFLQAEAEKKAIEEIIQKTKFALDAAQKKKQHAIDAVMKAAEGLDTKSLDDDIALLNQKSKDMIELFGQMGEDLGEDGVFNLSQKVIVNAEDIVRASKELIESLKQLQAIAKQKNAIREARKIAEANYGETLKKLAEAQRFQDELEAEGESDIFTEILLEKAEAYKEQAEAAFKKMESDDISLEDALSLSQVVLFKSNDMADLAENSIIDLQKKIAEVRRHKQVTALIKQAEEAVLFTESEAVNAKLIVDEMDVDLNMIKLIDAAKHADFQAKKARHIFEEMSPKMPVEAAQKILEGIMAEQKKAVANAVLVEDERKRIEAIVGFDEKPESALASNAGTGMRSGGIAYDDKVVRLLTENRHKTTLVTITRDGQEFIYKKVKHSWGGVYYFKDEVSISVLIYQQETGEY